MDSTPYFTAPSLKFAMGSGAAPSGTQSALIVHLCVSVILKEAPLYADLQPYTTPAATYNLTQLQLQLTTLHNSSCNLYDSFGGSCLRSNAIMQSHRAIDERFAVVRLFQLCRTTVASVYCA